MIIWLIGMSGSGKTAVGRQLYADIKKTHSNTVFLDGDMLRDLWKDNLGHTMEDRKTNADRICRLCKFLDDQGIHVVCAVLSIFHESQEWNRKNYASYYEVFLDVPLEELVRRDSKGLYKGALSGGTKNVIGVDLPFPKPARPDLTLANHGEKTVADTARAIFEKVKPMLR